MLHDYAGCPYNTPQRYTRLAHQHAGELPLADVPPTQRMDQRTDALEPPTNGTFLLVAAITGASVSNTSIGDTFAGSIHRECHDVAAARFFWAGHAFNQVLGGRAK